MTAVASRPELDELVTCVVVSYHRGDSVRRALVRLSHPQVAVIVVNVEDDPEIAALPGDHRVVGLPGNPGYAAAVNAGVAVASTEYVVFMNDDAEIGAESLLALVAPIAAGDADVTVPQVVDTHGEVERTIAAIPTPTALAREWMLLPDRPIPALDGRAVVEKWRLPTEPERVDAAAAVAVAVRRSTVVRTPLPEDYFLYWEESEWFWRLRELDLVVQYRPEIQCRHDGGRDDVRPEKSSLLARNAVRCVRRTQGRGAAIGALLVVIAWNLRLVVVDAGRQLAHRSNARGRLEARLAGLRSAVGSWRELR
jgi:GT2 family glycosyltransferase